MQAAGYLGHSGRAGALGVAGAMASKATRVKALDRSLIVKYAKKTDWRAQDRHAIADRTFKIFAAHTLPPKFRGAVTEQFKAFPLAKKEEWMRDARRFAVAQDVIHNLAPKQKNSKHPSESDPHVNALLELHKNASHEFVYKWVRDMAIQRALDQVKSTELIPDIKSELDELMEGAPASTHYAEMSKRGRQQLAKHLSAIYTLVKKSEVVNPLDLKENAELQEELQREILALLGEIGYTEEQVGMIIHTIQENYSELEFTKKVEWSESSEWVYAGGRSLSTLACLILAGILCSTWEEFKEYLYREERAATAALQKETTDFVTTAEEDISHMKVDLTSMTSTLDRLHIDKSNPESYKTIHEEIHDVGRRLSQLRKKVIELENSASQITVKDKEAVERKKHGITHELSKLQKIVIKRTAMLKALSTKQVWETTKKEVLSAFSYLKKAGLVKGTKKKFEQLSKSFQKLSRAAPTEENLSALKKIERKIRALAEVDLTQHPKRLQQATVAERGMLYKLVTKF